MEVSNGLWETFNTVVLKVQLPETLTEKKITVSTVT